jgi:hypothetical protein
MSDTKPTAAEVAIDAIREYFEDRQDASMEPGEDRFHGNKEMALLEEVAVVEVELAAAREQINVLKGGMIDLTVESDLMRKTLLRLDQLGGLGFDKHEAIKRALGVTYPRFCHHADKCAGKGRCMAERVCND